MSEILTQSQIDSLLSQLMSEESNIEDVAELNNEKKYKLYDFKCPKKFSKDELRLVRSIYDLFSRHLSSYLSGILRTPCQIRVNSIEELPYFEYNNALPDSVVMGIFDFVNYDGSFIIDFSNSITFSIIERLLGGTGTSSYREREFTDIEVALMKRILKNVESINQSSWSGYLDIENKLTKIFTNSRLLQFVGMDEIVVIIVMEINIKSVKGTISICIPNDYLEPLLDLMAHSVTATKRKADSANQDEVKQFILNKIKNSQVEAICELGNTTLNLNEVLNLQLGDVIKLNQTIDSKSEFKIGGKTWFKGIPGKIKNIKHFKITDVL